MPWTWFRADQSEIEVSIVTGNSKKFPVKIPLTVDLCSTKDDDSVGIP
jgi:hypothetical protein